jgi:hypothetical protein
LLYDVYLGLDPKPLIFVAGQTQDSCRLTNLLPDTTYFWKVVAEDNRGHKAEGPLWQFHTENTLHLVGMLPTPSEPKRVAVIGSYVYLLESGENGDLLRVIDVLVSESPRSLGVLHLSSVCNGFCVIGSLAYLHCGFDYDTLPSRYTEHFLVVADVSTPSDPRVLSSLRLPGIAASYGDVDVVGDYAYVADADSGLQVVDIHDAAKPFIAGSIGFRWPESTPAYEVVANNNLAIVLLHGDYAFNPLGKMVDVLDPEHPRILESSDILDYVVGVFMVQDRAYLANTSLKVVNLADPSHPVTLGQYVVPGMWSSARVFVESDLAYLAYLGVGLAVVDVHNPGSMKILGSYKANWNAYDVCASGGVIYLADRKGLRILRYSS